MGLQVRGPADPAEDGGGIPGPLRIATDDAYRDRTRIVQAAGDEAAFGIQQLDGSGPAETGRSPSVSRNTQGWPVRRR